MGDAEIRMRCLELIVPRSHDVLQSPDGWSKVFALCELLRKYIRQERKPS